MSCFVGWIAAAMVFGKSEGKEESNSRGRKSGREQKIKDDMCRKRLGQLLYSTDLGGL